MGFTANIYPPYMGAVRTPLFLNVTPDRYTTNALQFRSQFFVAFDDGCTAGETIQILYGTQDITMICVADTLADHDDGLCFEEAVSDTGAAQKFLDGCLQNHQLTTDYEIYRTGPIVYFTARRADPIYDLIDIVGGGGSTADGDQTQAAVSYEPRANFNTLLSVFVEDLYFTGAFGLLVQLDGHPADDLTVQWDLSTLLLGIPLNPDWPAWEAASALPCTKSQRRYFCRLAETFGTPPVVYASIQQSAYWGSETSPKLAWLAGREAADSSAWATYVATLNANAGGHPWMTWRNRTYDRIVSLDEQHYLGWHHGYARQTDDDTAEPEVLDLEATLTYTDLDGSNETTTSWTIRYADPFDTGVQANRSGIWAVGYTELDLAALLPADKLPVKYAVRLRAHFTGTVLSETMTFWIGEYEENVIHIQFINSLGIPESLRGTGGWNRSTEPQGIEQQYSGEVIETQLHTDVGVMRSDPSGTQDKLSIHTSFVPEAEHRALLDLLQSPAFRFEDTRRECFLPLRLVFGKEQKVKSRGDADEHLYALELEFLVGDPHVATTLLPLAT